MSEEKIQPDNSDEFDIITNEVRNLLKNAGTEILALVKDLLDTDKIMVGSTEYVYRYLDRSHLQLQDIYDRISSKYDVLREKYNQFRDKGIELIEQHIVNIRQKKNDLIQLGFEIDELIKIVENPDKILDLRQKEVLLFNDIEDYYSSVMSITSQIKNMDSKASQLGYEYAEFVGKVYGLNNTLMVMGNTLDIKLSHSIKSLRYNKPESEYISKKKNVSEFDYYIR